MAEDDFERLIAQGELAEAAKLADARMALNPRDVSAVRMKAEAAFRMGLREEGFAAAMSAVHLDPGNIAYGLDCAYNLIRAGRRDDALAIADLVAERGPSRGDHCDVLGSIYTHCERPELAIDHFRRAVECTPNSAIFRFNLASAQRMLGDIGGAETSLDAAIKLDNGNGDLYLARSQLRRQTDEHNHVDELKRTIAASKEGSARIALGYALAKELEDLGDYAEAFPYLAAASSRHRARLHYDLAQELRLMRRLGDHDYMASEGPLQHIGSKAAPIFVMGLPRSGTTLVDRIIASTGEAVSGGESNAVAAELWRVAARVGRPHDAASAVIDAIDKKGPQIGQAVADTMARRFANRRVIDKTPSNYLFAGLIAAHVPGARIVCLRRGAMDSCYAMYKTLFNETYPFSYDLGELGAYYLEWDRLIRGWEQRIGDAWLTVSYEELVQNPEPPMRRIIGHCGLQWSPACLDFHRLEAPVTSASAGQVNEPLHRRSVGMWRNYSDQLSGLACQLTQAGIPLEP